MNNGAVRGCCAPRRVADRRAVLESLESRQLLAGDLVAHWQADDLTATVGDGEQVDRWQDRVSQIPADRVDGSVELAANRLGGRAVLRFDAADGGDSLAVHKTVNPMAGESRVLLSCRLASRRYAAVAYMIDGKAVLALTSSAMRWQI